MKIISHHDTVSFIFDDSVLLRFKKADIALRTSNVSTELADLFDDHTMDLFGHRGLQRVEVVYVLNKFETEIIWTGVVATDCGSYLWDLELAPLIADMPIPFPSTRPQHGDTADLAKLKRQESEVIEFKKKEDAGEE